MAGMDSSDGLADAVLQICRASGVGAVLERDRVPLPPGLVDWVGSEKALDWALYGGEDFELVLCLPPELAELAVQRLPGAVIVGRMCDYSDVVLKAADSSQRLLTLEVGFQRF
ncbi:MAG: AIR synthase-related protein [Cyanobacteria bacterium J06641_5]